VCQHDCDGRPPPPFESHMPGLGHEPGAYRPHCPRSDREQCGEDDPDNQPEGSTPPPRGPSDLREHCFVERRKQERPGGVEDDDPERIGLRPVGSRKTKPPRCRVGERRVIPCARTSQKAAVPSVVAMKPAHRNPAKAVFIRDLDQSTPGSSTAEAPPGRAATVDRIRIAGRVEVEAVINEMAHRS